MKTIAQQLGVTEFPFEIKNGNGNLIYYEDSEAYWVKRGFDSEGRENYVENPNSCTKTEWDSEGRQIYYVNSKGIVRGDYSKTAPAIDLELKPEPIKQTIAQQLGVTEFPFEIRDKRGNDIYYENSDNYWVKCKYDEQGREVYHENSKGFWEKTEWDSEGNQIYYENLRGWIKWEYDLEGRQIYYENSKGEIKDKRPK